MGGSSSRTGPRVANFENGKVYFFTFPSISCSPTFSPFALKVETWLRFRSVDYHAIRGFSNWSSKGRIPFVELNGEEINESSHIIQALAEKLDCRDPDLTDEQRALARMVETMLDNHTFWAYGSYGHLSDESDKFFALWEGVNPLLKKVLPTMRRRAFGKRFVSHGIGRNTMEEVSSMGSEDLMALSGILGDKSFLFGEEMTSVDCAVFGHLAQILYLPLQAPMKATMCSEADNLVQYMNRIKEKVWPDWEQFVKENMKPTPIP